MSLGGAPGATLRTRSGCASPGQHRHRRQSVRNAPCPPPPGRPGIRSAVIAVLVPDPLSGGGCAGSNPAGGTTSRRALTSHNEPLTSHYAVRGFVHVYDCVRLSTAMIG